MAWFSGFDTPRKNRAVRAPFLADLNRQVAE
jgi:hypothetical protein